MLEDLADLEVYQALLSPAGVRGLVVECDDCHEPHYFDWDLLRGNLRHLLDSGRPRVHEPAYDPDPDHYVTWEYARGFADGVHDTLAEDDEYVRLGLAAARRGSRRARAQLTRPAEAGGHRVCPVAGTQLAEQPPGVGLHGVLGDEEFAADLGVALAVRHPAQHLQARRSVSAGRRILTPSSSRWLGTSASRASSTRPVPVATAAPADGSAGTPGSGRAPWSGSPVPFARTGGTAPPSAAAASGASTRPVAPARLCPGRPRLAGGRPVAGGAVRCPAGQAQHQQASGHRADQLLVPAAEHAPGTGRYRGGGHLAVLGPDEHHGRAGGVGQHPPDEADRVGAGQQGVHQDRVRRPLRQPCHRLRAGERRANRRTRTHPTRVHRDRLRGCRRPDAHQNRSHSGSLLP